jgi:hypothetical protein
MSLEDDGIQISWDEIKAASGRMDVDGRKREKQAERRMTREYLAHTDCEDPRVEEHVAIPGYN